jgi:predicted SpoU family rRNA methylase
MTIDIKKIINEAKNRCIMFKGGKLPKEQYTEKDYNSDIGLIEHFERIK